MSIPIPYRLDFNNLAPDDLISFVISVLIAITVNAEGQAFVATALGDIQSENKARFHFNPLFHIDIMGLLSFFIAGFGWPKNVPVDADKFSHPRLFTILTRLGGAAANFLLAGIAGSIIWLKQVYGSADNVFPILLSVNLMVAVYNFLPIPPLAGSSFISVMFLNPNHWLKKLYCQTGPFILLGILIADRITGWKIISPYIDPIVIRLYSFITG